MAEKSIKIWNVNVNNIVLSILVETENNYNYLIGCLDEVIIPLVLILFKINGYVKTSKVKNWDKDKYNKLMHFCINDEILLKSIKTFRLRLKT